MEDARKTLTLISGPKEVLNLAMLEEISGFLQDKAPKAVIRIGDYPRRRHEIAVTVVISQLTHVTRLETLFKKAEELFTKREEISTETAWKIDQLRESTKNIPVLD
jgi:cell division GTPase FtsZ